MVNAKQPKLAARDWSDTGKSVKITRIVFLFLPIRYACLLMVWLGILEEKRPPSSGGEKQYISTVPRCLNN